MSPAENHDLRASDGLVDCAGAEGYGLAWQEEMMEELQSTGVHIAQHKVRKI